MDSEFSSDMVYEILSRASLKTLAKSRLVSKQCNLLTYESSFLNLHSQRTQIVSGFFLQSMKKNEFSSTFVSAENPECKNISLDFLPVPSVTIRASSVQGLLVCVDQRTRIHQYYVCKPLTKEWQLIPNPKTKYFTESIAIKVLKSNPLEYKIVRLSRPKQWFIGFKYRGLRCEIYDSVVGKWRQAEEMIRLPYDDELISWEPAISVGGRFHWLTMEKSIFRFDVDDEKYSLFPLPNWSKRYNKVHLTDYEGKLGVICKGDKFFDLWVLESDKKRKWSKKVNVCTESVEKKKNQTVYPAAFCNADVALVPGYYSVMFFKFKNESRVDEVRLENNVMSEGAYPFRSDFELCNMKNELFDKHYSKGRLRRNKPEPREEENSSSSQPWFTIISPSFIFVLVLFLFTLVCFVLDF
ncbi:F-box associated ubiquitination effector family protein [Euphorbia peplus]|nr:F-box associated ubiquitination effector family protein [Euphorbia peplus]